MALTGEFATKSFKEGGTVSELVKALSQRIDELEKENLSLKNKV